ncbi:MAG: hypothetical protein J0M33_14515 [Anaerolineae bacterium]|nr:hypothetical protein [Anaerolineae bacterium]
MEVTVNLPQDVIEDVRAEGLALDALLSDLLRGEMRRRKAAQQLGEMVAAIRAVEPPLTEAEIQAELDARKAERLASS